MWAAEVKRPLSRPAVALRFYQKPARTGLLRGLLTATYTQVRNSSGHFSVNFCPIVVFIWQMIRACIVSLCCHKPSLGNTRECKVAEMPVKAQWAVKINEGKMVHFCFIDFCWSMNPLHFMYPFFQYFSPVGHILMLLLYIKHRTESVSCFSHMELLLVAMCQVWRGAQWDETEEWVRWKG